MRAIGTDGSNNYSVSPGDEPAAMYAEIGPPPCSAERVLFASNEDKLSQEYATPHKVGIQ